MEFDEMSIVDAMEGSSHDHQGTISIQYEGNDVILIRTQRYEDDRQYEVLRFDKQSRIIRFQPRITRVGSLAPQFGGITELQIESPDWDPDNHSAENRRYGLLYATGLPQGFKAIYEYGLGIRRDYEKFVTAIESRTVARILRFTLNASEYEGESQGIYRVSLDRFDRYRAAVDRSKSRGYTAVGRVIDADTHNAVSDLFGEEPVSPKYAKNSVINALTEEIDKGHITTAEERELLATELTKSAAALADESPGRVYRLQQDIELVNLDSLITRFELELGGSESKIESRWQTFFNTNPFLLQLVFSAPLVVSNDQVHVKAAGARGDGSIITDFLCANIITRTAFAVEIKTPAAKLVAAQPFRGARTDAAVYAPHKDLISAIAQLQSQMSFVPRSLASRLTAKDNLDPWHDIQGALIVGKLSSLDQYQRESFVRFRGSLSNITVLGYDEVLERLRSLRAALRETELG